MKCTPSSLLLAAATAVLAIPAPPSDGGNGIPPVATISDPHGALAASATTLNSVLNVSTDPHPTTSSPAAPAPSGANQPDIQIPFSDSNALFTLSPADPKAWTAVKAPGVFNVTARFSIANQDKASAKFAPPQPFAGLKVYAYQRSDGGLMGLFIDGKPTARLDYFNKTAGPNDPPVLLWENPHLARDHHVVEFKNMVDDRVGKAGQFNIDHVVITAAADAPLTPPKASTPPKPTETKSAPATTTSTSTTTTPVASTPADQDTGFPPNANANAAQSQQTPPPNGAAARGVSAALVAGVTIVASAWFALV